MKTKMRPFYHSILMSVLIFFPVLSGWAAGEMTASQVKSELEQNLSKIIPPDHFLVNVAIETDTVSEKRISEGETVTQSNPGNEIKVPPLPGFDLPKPQAAAFNGQSRQTYKMVDRDVVKSVNAEVDFDQTLDAETIEQAKGLTHRYLEASFGNKANVSFGKVHMIANQTAETTSPSAEWFSKNWPLLASIFLFVTLLGFLAKALFLPKATPVYPKVMGQPTEEEGDIRQSYARNGNQLYPKTNKPLALPSGSYPPLPATEKFIDGRTELLQVFLKNSEIFRLYYGKLSEATQMELYSGLRGPAFDSLLETLDLERPKGNENTPPPTEEQMLFYQKNFQEFIETNSWQHSQFFGFLKQLTLEQLTTLLNQENPVVSAVILKLCKPDDSAHALSSLTSAKRTEILGQFHRAQSLSSEELLAVEASVREKVLRLPKLLLGYNRHDADYWSKVLTHSENQEELLLDLEKSRPDLYPVLAKFRFKLDDLPSLPPPLVHKVLDEIDNEELALALYKCSKPVIDFALTELGTDRRALIASQLTMYAGMPEEKLSLARQSVTLKFREVIA